jgi:hypothetical protein
MYPTLENWHCATYRGDAYASPEAKALRLKGEVFGHPEFFDGCPVTTSVVRELNIDAGFAQTANTRYTLGAPAAKFMEHLALACPELHRRLADRAARSVTWLGGTNRVNAGARL